ncbi:MAG: ATPase family associated with various cellular [Acidobacteria bacterium]|nr:ATPase family associated with various cellular [Acidobacteriota bacterium]
MRDEGKKALRQELAGQQFTGQTSRTDPKESNIWHEETMQSRHAPDGSLAPRGSQILEDATVLRALLCHRRPDAGQASPATAQLVVTLEKNELETLSEKEDDNLPILRAARVLIALAAAPDSALSTTAIYCYYIIMRELYSGDAPDWVIGGARAGEGLGSCAFVTNECIHALLAFERTLIHTAEHIESILEMLKRRRPPEPLAPESLELFSEVSEWLEIDDRRARLDLEITSELRKENIALGLPSIGNDGLANFLQSVTEKVQEQLTACQNHLGLAIKNIDEHFKAEDKSFTTKDRETEERRVRATAGHGLSICVLEAAFDSMNRAVTPLTEPTEGANSDEIALRAASWFFRKMVLDVRRALEPASEYVSRALDRELTAAASETAIWDVGELLFAAVSHGYLSGRWDEERLRSAAAYASKVVSERGRFPMGQPIHLSPRGYNLHVLNVDIIRALAELLHHTETPVDPNLMKRLMYFMEDTRTNGVPGTWTPSEELRSGLPWRSTTASTVLALDAVNKMLDSRINEEILRHFSVRRPEELDVPDLAELFYPDYGLASSQCDPDLRRSESVAVTLQRMRAHVSGVLLRAEYPERLFSLILHGPPGTGKTTLVESLAKTCGVRLVEITPSDLVADGVDSIERTARAVFRALSLLTRVVIIFDEFDPVLLQRHDDQKEATAFSFLTPGMLPKLKTLHSSASRRSVAYVLNTNLIGKLDDAAIRGGRFDAKVGIYPPDLLSRAGRLAWAVAKYVRDAKSTVDLMPRFKERFERAVLSIRLGPMNTLAKPGWFSVPREILPEQLRKREDVFNYLFSASKMKELDVEAEPRVSSDKAIALRELKEHLYVDLWDRVAFEGIPQELDAGHTQYSDQTLAEAVSGVSQRSAKGEPLLRTLTQALEKRPEHRAVDASASALMAGGSRITPASSPNGGSSSSPVGEQEAIPSKPNRKSKRAPDVNVKD